MTAARAFRAARYTRHDRWQSSAARTLRIHPCGHELRWPHTWIDRIETELAAGRDRQARWWADQGQSNALLGLLSPPSLFTATTCPKCRGKKGGTIIAVAIEAPPAP